MMMNEHILNVNNGVRIDSPPLPPNPEILNPFSRGVSKNHDPAGVRYHPHAQTYYPHHSANPSSRFPPSPGPSGPRLPHLSQSGPPPYHYGYF
jgi:hypothetical protein